MHDLAATPQEEMGDLHPSVQLEFNWPELRDAVGVTSGAAGHRPLFVTLRSASLTFHGHDDGLECFCCVPLASPVALPEGAERIFEIDPGLFGENILLPKARSQNDKVTIEIPELPQGGAPSFGQRCQTHFTVSANRIRVQWPVTYLPTAAEKACPATETGGDLIKADVLARALRAVLPMTSQTGRDYRDPPICVADSRAMTYGKDARSFLDPELAGVELGIKNRQASRLCRMLKFFAGDETRLQPLPERYILSRPRVVCIIERSALGFGRVQHERLEAVQGANYRAGGLELLGAVQKIVAQQTKRSGTVVMRIDENALLSFEVELDQEKARARAFCPLKPDPNQEAAEPVLAVLKLESLACLGALSNSPEIQVLVHKKLVIFIEGNQALVARTYLGRDDKKEEALGGGG